MPISYSVLCQAEWEKPTGDIVVITEAGAVEAAGLCLVTVWTHSVGHRGAQHVSRPHPCCAFVTWLQINTVKMSRWALTPSTLKSRHYFKSACTWASWEILLCCVILAALWKQKQKTAVRQPHGLAMLSALLEAVRLQAATNLHLHHCQTLMRPFKRLAGHVHVSHYWGGWSSAWALFG